MPLPDWAAEVDAKTWAQLFLKYVISHPAVTVVRAGTTKAAHMLDNIGGGMGRLPNEAMRSEWRRTSIRCPAAHGNEQLITRVVFVYAHRPYGRVVGTPV
jgi:hypothetical protein